jgi:hypothetical protein
MRTGIPAALVHVGTLFLGFGFTITVLWLVGAHYGARIHSQPFAAAVGLIGGGVMVAAGYLMDRSRKRS